MVMSYHKDLQCKWSMQLNDMHKRSNTSSAGLVDAAEVHMLSTTFSR